MPASVGAVLSETQRERLPPYISFSVRLAHHGSQLGDQANTVSNGDRKCGKTLYTGMYFGCSLLFTFGKPAL